MILVDHVIETEILSHFVFLNPIDDCTGSVHSISLMSIEM